MQDDQDSPQNPTWARSKPEQKRSREARATERRLRAAGSYNSPQANNGRAATPSTPKKGKWDEAFYSPLQFNSVYDENPHEGWISPLPAKRGLTASIEQAHQEEIREVRMEFPTPTTPPSVTGYLARFDTPHFADRNITSPLTPFQSTHGSLLQFSPERSPEKPDACVTAIRNVKAFIENAMANQSFDCDAALKLLNNERDNVLNAMDDLDADDLNSREVHSEVIANFVFMIQRVEDRKAQRQDVSQEDVREFMNVMEPQRQEVVAKLF